MKKKKTLKKILFILQLIIELVFLSIILWYFIRFSSGFTMIFLESIGYNFSY